MVEDESASGGTMVEDESASGGGELRAGSIAGIQVAAVVLGSVVLALLGRGSLASLAAGAAFMQASFLLQRFAVRSAFQPGRSPGVAIGLIQLKLVLILGLLYVGLTTSLLGPASFAAGATTLPMAIVIDVCYFDWSRRRAKKSPNP